jgi:UDP-N-acetylmuramate dehydrogenase
MASPNKIPNAKLSEYTTFRLGGPCRELIECVTPDELRATVRALAKANSPFILIGGGSNLVVSDYGLDLTVIRYVSSTPLIMHNGTDLTVSGSTDLDAVALYSVEEGLEGFVYTSGIPGTVGGAVVGNAGAWGKQVGDVLKSAVLIDKQGNEKTVGRDYFEFTYRNSKLKETDEIVVEVTFELKAGDPIALAQERAEILRMRSEKHPNLNTHPCAGSFFRNVEPTSKAGRREAAGWFLEQAGGKELKSGGAQIFDKHANIIVKGPNCKAQDVYNLQQEMIRIVNEKFGFLLNREVRFVGKFDSSASKHEGFW